MWREVGERGQAQGGRGPLADAGGQSRLRGIAPAGQRGDDDE